MTTHRVLRSRVRSQQADDPRTSASTLQAGHLTYQLKQQNEVPIEVLPKTLTSKTIGLPKRDLATLKLKRSKLLSPSSQTASFITDLADKASASSNALTAAARGTLVFAQQEAGTAVCITPSGLVLTCANCVAETDEEYAANKPYWLIFSSGQVVRAQCVAWDARRDLALLRITAAEPLDDVESPASEIPFPFARIAYQPPLAPKKKQATSLLCIGHPGSEDLEAVPTSKSSTPVPSGYDVLHVSYGRYRGLAPGQDVQDNSEIGALQHDCWTYWGHSGAPLIDAERGEIIGLHSSWDDETGMRRGVGWEALKEFLEEWCAEV